MDLIRKMRKSVVHLRHPSFVSKPGGLPARRHRTNARPAARHHPPGRDYASTDHVYGTRNYPTACAALILSLKEKHLQITGAPQRTGAGDPARPASAVSARPARALSPEKRALLDPARLAALAEISHAGELKPLPVSISKASSKVWPTNLALGTNAVELVGKGTLGTTANATDYVNARRQLPLHHPVLLSGARRRARGRSQA